MVHEPLLAAPRKLLEVAKVKAGYGPLQVLWDVSLHVGEGEFVALVGPNGSGKTTTLRVIAGLMKPLSGSIRFRGQPTLGLKANQVSQRGIAFLSESLNLFPGMSVRDNLLLGAYAKRDRNQVAAKMEFVFGFYPILKERLGQLAGTLSGGERRMLGLARALMSAPLLLLVDEPSLGLSPYLADQTFTALEKLNCEGVAILLVEQNISRTLGAAARAYVLEQGRIVLEGASSELLKTDHLRKSYLGQL